jgi:hypothetical protein
MKQEDEVLCVVWNLWAGRAIFPNNRSNQAMGMVYAREL